MNTTDATATRDDNNCKHQRCRASGFTLIELMLALVIIAILAGVAFPAYQGQVRKGGRSEAATLLLQVATKQETYYLDNDVYASDLTKLGYSAAQPVTDKGFYKISANVPANGQSFALTATRQGPQVKDTLCGDLTLNNLGLRSAVNHTDTDPAKNCW